MQVANACLLIDLDADRRLVVAEDAFEVGRKDFALASCQLRLLLECDEACDTYLLLDGTARGLLSFSLVFVSTMRSSCMALVTYHSAREWCGVVVVSLTRDKVDDFTPVSCFRDATRNCRASGWSPANTNHVPILQASGNDKHRTSPLCGYLLHQTPRILSCSRFVHTHTVVALLSLSIVCLITSSSLCPPLSHFRVVCIRPSITSSQDKRKALKITHSTECRTARSLRRLYRPF